MNNVWPIWYRPSVWKRTLCLATVPLWLGCKDPSVAPAGKSEGDHGIRGPNVLGRHSITDNPQTAPTEQAPDAVGFLADGTVLSSGPWPQGGRVRRWNLATRTSAQLATSKDMAIAVSPSGKLFAVNENAAPDHIDIYRANGDRSSRVAQGLYPHLAEFSAGDGCLVVATEGDNKLVRVNLSDGEVTEVAEANPDQLIQAVGVSAACELVASGGNRVRIFSASRPNSRIELSPEFLNVASLGFTEKGDLLVTASENLGVQLWKAKDGTLQRTLYEGDGAREQGASNAAYAAAMRGDLLVTGHGNGELRVWNLGTGTLIDTLKDGPANTILDLAFDVAGTSLVSLDRKGNVLTWQLKIN